jgi:hypothetical protein
MWQEIKLERLAGARSNLTAGQAKILINFILNEMASHWGVLIIVSPALREVNK